MLVTDFDEMEARRQAEASEVRHVDIAAPIVEEQHQTHEAVAGLDLGVDHDVERSPAAPPIDFGENPLLVNQQTATHDKALHAIR